jgi:hypothetical protein
LFFFSVRNNNNNTPPPRLWTQAARVVAGRSVRRAAGSLAA